MDHDEVQQLIPMYVANSLRPEERAEVEKAITSSDELRKDVAFWQKARLAAQAHAEYAAAKHLSSEQIVDYAERAAGDPRFRLKIESHLQACNECREEYEMILKTIPRPHRRSEVSVVDRVKQFVTSFKPIYALPAVAMLVAGVLLWRALETGGFPARLVLAYQGEIRGVAGELPRVLLNASPQTVQLLVCIPHDSLVATMYTATLTTPKRETMTLPGSYSKTVSPRGDTLFLSLDAQSLRWEGEYTLTLAEVPSSLPPGTTPFPPEPYRFHVRRGVK